MEPEHARIPALESRSDATKIRTNVIQSAHKYMLANRILGNKIPRPQLERLNRANETIINTRNKLNVGRGNIDPDIAETGGHNKMLVSKSQSIQGEIRNHSHGELPNKDYMAIAGATSEHVRAANCHGHAALSTTLFLQNRLGDDESVSMVGTEGHAWSELRGIDATRQKDNVVIDAWASGSAVFSQHSTFSSKASTIDTTVTTADKEDITSLLGVIKPNLPAVDAVKAKVPNWHTYGRESNVLKESFRNQANEAWAKMGTKERVDAWSRSARRIYTNLTPEQRKEHARAWAAQSSIY